MKKVYDGPSTNLFRKRVKNAASISSMFFTSNRTLPSLTRVLFFSDAKRFRRNNDYVTGFSLGRPSWVVHSVSYHETCRRYAKRHFDVVDVVNDATANDVYYNVMMSNYILTTCCL